MTCVCGHMHLDVKVILTNMDEDDGERERVRAPVYIIMMAYIVTYIS